MNPNEFDRLSQSLQQWIRDNFSPNRTSEELGYELAGYVVSISMTSSSRITGDIQGSINEALRTAKHLWSHAQACVKNEYNLDLSDNGVVVFVMTMCAEQKGWTYAPYFMDGLGVVFPECIGSAMPEVIDRTTIENIDEADGELIKDFFSTFQQLGIYHRNPADYEDDDKRELHNHLMALYYKISGS